MKKIYLAFISTILLFKIYPFENLDDKLIASCCTCSSGCSVCDIPEEPINPSYNLAANYHICSSFDTYFTGSFLLIQPMQGRMDFCLTEEVLDTSYKINHVDFDWKIAFKAGMGHNFHYDRWNAFAEYTRIATTTKNYASLNDNVSIENLWLQQQNGDVKEITSEWKLNFNIFDLYLGRSFYNGKKLTFNVNFGFKGGWINQKIHLENLNTLDQKNMGDFISHSWLIGPRFGFTSSWKIASALRIFGNGSASIFYQKFNKISHYEPLFSDPMIPYYSLNHTHTFINSSLDGIVGIGIGSYFCRNSWHIDFTLGYEVNLFFNQNMLIYPQEFPYSSTQANLMYHGLNATMRVDF